jgi:hypothetical protein
MKRKYKLECLNFRKKQQCRNFIAGKEKLQEDSGTVRRNSTAGKQELQQDL